MASWRAAVRDLLVHWKSEPDLAALREPDKPNNLSPVELESRRRLWRDLDELIKRIDSAH